MALAVGGDTDMSMLNRFVAGTGHEVFTTDQADGIVKFFKFVTMSVVTRTRSQNPNQVPNDREVKPLPAPSLVEDTAEEPVATYETPETAEPVVVEVETVEPAPVSGGINLDDEDDFWF